MKIIEQFFLRKPVAIISQDQQCQRRMFDEWFFFPPETDMAMEHLQSLIGHTSSDGCFSIVMLVFAGVTYDSDTSTVLIPVNIQKQIY